MKFTIKYNSNALYNLGFCYEKGNGVEKDLNKAKEYYEKAAGFGYEDALNFLNRLGNNNK